MVFGFVFRIFVMVGFEIGEDGKEFCQKGDEEPDLVFVIIVLVYITFPEVGENSLYIYVETVKISGIS